MQKILISILVLFACSTSALAVDPRDVDAAIANAKKYLYSKQKDDSWEEEFKTHGDQETGQTALVVYALLSSGESYQDPRLAKAITYLKKTPTSGTYALGVRCELWNVLPQTPDVRTVMASDAKLLINGIQATAKTPGFYGYNIGVGTAYSLSRAHYAVLGVWAAAQSGVDVPNSYWQLVEKSWIAQQDPSGGWAYKGRDGTDKGDDHPVTPGITADGIATLFITQDYLHADEAINPHGNIKNAHIDKALAWMTANFDKVAKDESFSRDYPAATMYAIERIGTASGYKYFNNINWYEIGAKRFLRNQLSTGAWKGDRVGSDISSTCFAILFLSRGRAPIVFNKLEYELAGGKVSANWNQRPRDAANVTRWIGKQSERELNWQTVNLNAPLSDLHDSAILYIDGNQLLKFSAEDTAKLRQFIEEGGMLLGNSDAGANAFTGGFKKLGRELFPDYEFRQLPLDHTIFKHEQFPIEKWKRKPAVLGLGNGAREFMLILPDVDLARAWQLQESKSKEELFQLAANVFLYSVDKKDARLRGETYLVELDPKIKTTRAVKLARIKYKGNWNPEPGGWRRMTAVLNNLDHTAMSVIEADPEKDSLAGVKVAHLTGVGKFKLSEPARAALKKFVEDGGTLIADATGGGADSATSIESELGTIFGAGAVKQLKEPLPAESAVYRIDGKKIDDVGYRLFAREKLAGELKGPRLRGVTINGRLAVVYSPEDLSVGLVGQPVDGIVGYKPATATTLLRAMLLNAINPPPASQAASQPTSQPASQPGTNPTTNPR